MVLAPSGRRILERIVPHPGDPMRFFRHLMRPTPVLLLVAAMQAALVLAQVHGEIHAHGHAHMPAAWTSGEVAAVALACRAVVRHPDCDGTRRPEQQPHRPEHRNDCATCWSLATAGSGVLPALPPAAIGAPRFSRYELPH
ncbi:MAG TPA: hypothetical protein VNR51_08470, partial [Hyphomicrobium sp.]|nr:hypothetical protein [Hyphomicrobium sp.]